MFLFSGLVCTMVTVCSMHKRRQLFLKSNLLAPIEGAVGLKTKLFLAVQINQFTKMIISMKKGTPKLADWNLKWVS